MKIRTHKGYRRGAQFEINFAANCGNGSEKPNFLGYKSGIRKIVKEYRTREERPFPRTFNSTMVFNKVQELLNEQHRDYLELYDSLGTSLDYHHGVDGFFMLRNRIATFDLSLSKGPKEIKANILISLPDLTYSTPLYNLGKKIARILERRVMRGHLAL